MRKKLFALLALTFCALTANAQSSDMGIWYSIGAEKKINKKFSIEAEGEMRTRNDAKTIDRWSAGVDAEYKIKRWLKASAGYTFLYDDNKNKITSGNNYYPHYWGARHRINVSLTGDVNCGRFNLSLRERWQYTYRPEKTVDRYDLDNSVWETKTKRAKGKNVLKSRFQVKYDIPLCKVDPYANVEVSNAWNVEKVRYTIGADWKIKKSHTVGLYYRYQNITNDDDEAEPDMHIIGVNYKFKF
jgi:opacity protein-like surface antigen